MRPAGPRGDGLDHPGLRRLKPDGRGISVTFVRCIGTIVKVHRSWKLRGVIVRVGLMIQSVKHLRELLEAALSEADVQHRHAAAALISQALDMLDADESPRLQ